MTTVGYYCPGCEQLVSDTVMDDDKLLKLMDEIQKSRHEVEAKLSSLLAELKQEMNFVQERTS